MESVSRPEVGEMIGGLIIEYLSSIADYCQTLANDANMDVYFKA